MFVGGATVDGPQGKQIQSLHEMCGRFTGEIVCLIQIWEKELAAKPDRLESIERDVHKVFTKCSPAEQTC